MHVLSLESSYKPIISSLVNSSRTHDHLDHSIQPSLALLTSTITLANEAAQFRGDAMSLRVDNR